MKPSGPLRREHLPDSLGDMTPPPSSPASGEEKDTISPSPSIPSLYNSPSSSRANGRRLSSSKSTKTTVYELTPLGQGTRSLDLPSDDKPNSRRPRMDSERDRQSVVSEPGMLGGHRGSQLMPALSVSSAGTAEQEPLPTTPNSVSTDAILGTTFVPDYDDLAFDDRPTPRRLWQASTCELTDENGKTVLFGDLMPRWPATLPPSKRTGTPPRTVVFFIRTFMCGQCQDYMFASISRLNAEVIATANVRIVIISNGHWKVIKRYRALFNCPFPVFVDADLELYSLFGLSVGLGGTPPVEQRPAYHRGRNRFAQALQGAWNGIVHMPFALPGSFGQLGGEFVLNPNYQCSFASRMTSRFDHTEAPDVLRAAGVPFPTKDVDDRIQHSEAQLAELESLEKEMAQWRERRAAGGEKMRQRKARKRGLPFHSLRPQSKLALGLDDELREGWEKVGAVGTRSTRSLPSLSTPPRAALRTPSFPVSSLAPQTPPRNRGDEADDSWFDAALATPGLGPEIEVELRRRIELNKMARGAEDKSQERKWFEI